MTLSRNIRIGAGCLLVLLAAAMPPWSIDSGLLPPAFPSEQSVSPMTNWRPWLLAFAGFLALVSGLPDIAPIPLSPPIPSGIRSPRFPWRTFAGSSVPILLWWLSVCGWRIAGDFAPYHDGEMIGYLDALSKPSGMDPFSGAMMLQGLGLNIIPAAIARAYAHPDIFVSATRAVAALFGIFTAAGLAAVIACALPGPDSTRRGLTAGAVAVWLGGTALASGEPTIGAWLLPSNGERFAVLFLQLAAVLSAARGNRIAAGLVGILAPISILWNYAHGLSMALPILAMFAIQAAGRDWKGMLIAAAFGAAFSTGCAAAIGAPGMAALASDIFYWAEHSRGIFLFSVDGSRELFSLPSLITLIAASAASISVFRRVRDAVRSKGPASSAILDSTTEILLLAFLAANLRKALDHGSIEYIGYVAAFAMPLALRVAFGWIDLRRGGEGGAFFPGTILLTALCALSSAHLADGLATIGERWTLRPDFEIVGGGRNAAAKRLRESGSDCLLAMNSEASWHAISGLPSCSRIRQPFFSAADTKSQESIAADLDSRRDPILLLDGPKQDVWIPHGFATSTPTLSAFVLDRFEPSFEERGWWVWRKGIPLAKRHVLPSAMDQDAEVFARQRIEWLLRGKVPDGTEEDGSVSVLALSAEGAAVGYAHPKEGRFEIAVPADAAKRGARLYLSRAGALVPIGSSPPIVLWKCPEAGKGGPCRIRAGKSAR